MSNNNCLTEQEITLYCSEDLELDRMRSAAEHFAACQSCRNQLAATKQTIASIPQHELHLSEAEKLRFADRVIDSSRKKSVGSRIQAWGAAATAVTAGVLAVMVFNPDNLVVNSGQNQTLQYAELDLVENMEMLEDLELLEMMELLEMIEDKI